MRTLKIALAGLLACGALALAQPSAKPDAPKKATPKTELEKALEDALSAHPDIRIAEAKLALAQAELAKARSEVTQKVVLATGNVRTSRAMLKEAILRLERIKRAGATVSREEVGLAELTVQRYQAELEAAEATLKALRGGGTAAATADKKLWHHAFSPDGKLLFSTDDKVIRVWDSVTGKELGRHLWPSAGTKAAVGTTMAERIRKAMDGKAKIKETVEANKVMARLRELSGLEIKVVGGPGFDSSVSFNFGEVPLGAIFQYAEDSAMGNRFVFVVREYGLLFVPEDKIPPGAVTLMAFWKGADKAAEKKGDAKKDLNGKVIEVDGSKLKLDIGSDAGLYKVEMLEAFRLGPTPRYLGKVRIVDAQAKTSVAETVGRWSTTARVGDSVARRLIGR
jgi:hypothetical protein